MPVKTFRRSRSNRGDATKPPLPTGFAQLWIGQTTSHLGAEISLLVLPLIAATTLGGTPGQLGWLTAAAMLPWLAALPIGAWIDRIRTRNVIITAELARATTVAAIPTAWALDALNFPLLYTLAAAGGIAGVFFDTAWGAAIPRIVGHDALLTANSRLAAAKSATSVAGPGIGGLLVRAVGAPLALIVNTLGYLTSALTIWRAMPADRRPPAPERPENLLTAIRAGLAIVAKQPELRAIACQAAIWNAVSGANEALFVLYALRVLHLDAGGIGIMFMIAGVGAITGAATIPALLRRFPYGTLYIAGVTIAITGMLLLATAGRTTIPLPMVATGQFLIGIGIAATSVQAISLRQSLTPAHLLARTLATYRLLSFGTIPLGSVAAGILGDTIGIADALLTSAIAATTALIPLVLSPIRRRRHLPTNNKGTK